MSSCTLLVSIILYHIRRLKSIICSETITAITVSLCFFNRMHLILELQYDILLRMYIGNSKQVGKYFIVSHSNGKKKRSIAMYYLINGSPRKVVSSASLRGKNPVILWSKTASPGYWRI